MQASRKARQSTRFSSRFTCKALLARSSFWSSSSPRLRTPRLVSGAGVTSKAGPKHLLEGREVAGPNQVDYERHGVRDERFLESVMCAMPAPRIERASSLGAPSAVTTSVTRFSALRRLALRADRARRASTELSAILLVWQGRTGMQPVRLSVEAHTSRPATSRPHRVCAPPASAPPAHPAVHSPNLRPLDL